MVHARRPPEIIIKPPSITNAPYEPASPDLFEIGIAFFIRMLFHPIILASLIIAGLCFGIPVTMAYFNTKKITEEVNVKYQSDFASLKGESLLLPSSEISPVSRMMLNEPNSGQVSLLFKKVYPLLQIMLPLCQI